MAGYTNIRPVIARHAHDFPNIYDWLHEFILLEKRMGKKEMGGYAMLDTRRNQFGVKRVGEKIAVRLYDTHVAYVDKIDNEWASIKLVSTGWAQERQYTRTFLSDVLGIAISNVIVSGQRTMSVRVSNDVDKPHTPLYEGLTVKTKNRWHNILTSEPRRFTGVRVDKEATKEVRSRFQQVYDLLPVYCAANPNAQYLRAYETLTDLQDWQIEEEIEHIVQYVCSKSRNRKTWNKTEPACPQRARQFLNRLLTITEEYETDKSFA